MITQTIKGWALFLSSIFTIMAIVNYFGSGKVYPVLISASFIIYLLGEIAIWGLNYHVDRRKLQLTAKERKNWMFQRQAD